MADAPSSGALTPQARLGLLNYVTSTALDEDYAHLRDRRAPGRRSRASAAAVLAAFGVLVATAGVETARNADADQRGHAGLVAQVRTGRATLDTERKQLAALQSSVLALQQRSSGARADQSTVEAALGEVAAVTGDAAVTGPGVRVEVAAAKHAVGDADVVLDSDLRDIVNALWYAGAEAVAVNGERLTTLSAIRVAGGRITVNYADVLPPYVVLAIGDPDALADAFSESSSGKVWLANQQAYGLQFGVSKRGEVSVPAAPSARLDVRTATVPTAGEAGKGSG